MAAGTKFRTLARLLDLSDTPVWVIGPAGKLIYLSAGVGAWLGIEADRLLDRRSVAGSAISDDPLDFVAASMSPPPGFVGRGYRFAEDSASAAGWSQDSAVGRPLCTHRTRCRRADHGHRG